MRRLLGPMVAMLGIAWLASCCDAAEPTLVGHWPFDEREGLMVADASGKGRDGEILNESRGVKWVAGRSGGALEFSGGDQEARNVAGCVAIAGFEGIDWSEGLTVELWMRFTKVERPLTYEIVSNTVADRGPGFRLFHTWSMLSLRSGEGGDGATWGAASDPAEVLLGTDEWYHLAGTYDGSAFRVYVDGVLVGRSDEGLELTAGDGVIYVGAYRGGFAYGLNAVIDDLRLYSSARTHAQIALDARLGD